MASYEIEDYPNEKLVYVKFLDDNDPRLLLLVTYHGPSETTYMKVLKIEKAKVQKNPDPGQNLGSTAKTANPLPAASEGEGGQQSRGAPPRKRSFSYYEHAPYDKLKQEVLNTNQDKGPSADPNQADAAEGAPKRPASKKPEPGIRPNENLKATLMVKKDQSKADLSISSMGMRTPIRMKMDWDPIRNFENILIR